MMLRNSYNFVRHKNNGSMMKKIPMFLEICTEVEENDSTSVIYFKKKLQTNERIDEANVAKC